ncbi:hypothetical protein FRC06_007327 [Ceratobasidium sp. 370]|nr:hypothetical protein FRC06_007327 [Ceratobasidium sp. 370]
MPNTPKIPRAVPVAYSGTAAAPPVPRTPASSSPPIALPSPVPTSLTPPNLNTPVLEAGTTCGLFDRSKRCAKLVHLSPSLPSSVENSPIAPFLPGFVTSMPTPPVPTTPTFLGSPVPFIALTTQEGYGSCAMAEDYDDEMVENIIVPESPVPVDLVSTPQNADNSLDQPSVTFDTSYASPNHSYTASTNPHASPSRSPPSLDNFDFTPNDDYTTPNDCYATPNDSYATPNDPCTTPNDVYTTPIDQYVTPTNHYATPVSPYATPYESYATPKDSYATAGDPYATLYDDSYATPDNHLYAAPSNDLYSTPDNHLHATPDNDPYATPDNDSYVNDSSVAPSYLVPDDAQALQSPLDTSCEQITAFCGDQNAIITLDMEYDENELGGEPRQQNEQVLVSTTFARERKLSQNSSHERIIWYSRAPTSTHER